MHSIFLVKSGVIGAGGLGGAKHRSTFVKVVEGPLIYNFADCIVHFSSGFGVSRSQTVLNEMELVLHRDVACAPARTTTRQPQPRRPGPPHARRTKASTRKTLGT
jgi:hypothetical protein